MIEPLLLGPTEYTFDREFAQSVDIAQLGGVHIQEYGSILGRINIQVNPGIRPRMFANRKGAPAIPLSGLARFLSIRYLMDMYSTAKQDPASAEGTRLIFHSLQEQDSWVVVPVRFSLPRTSRDPVAHPYRIEMIAVERADAISLAQSPDESLFDKIKNPARWLRNIIVQAQATIDDATYYLDQTRQSALAYNSIISTMSSLIQSASSFLGGVQSFVRVPITTMAHIDDMLDQLASTADDWRDMSAEARNWWRNMQYQAERLALFPDLFCESMDDRIAANRESKLGAARYSGSALANPTGTLAGTGALSTDAMRASAVSAGQSAIPYSGSREITIQASDTPDGLAVRWDVPWVDIAAANGLRSPYICEASLPGTVAVGDKILIPLRTSKSRFMPAITLGNQLGASQQEMFFGADIRLDADEGFGIDTLHGGEDLDLAVGMDNMMQALTLRVETEQQTNPCYPNFGRTLKIGELNTLEERLLAEVSLRRCLLQDDRIQSVDQANITGDADSAQIDVDLTLANWQTTRAQGRIGA